MCVCVSVWCIYVHGVVYTVIVQVGGTQEEQSLNIAIWYGCLSVNVGSFIKYIIILQKHNAIVNRKRQCVQKVSAS